MALTITQIKEIKNKLEKSKLQYQPLQDELLDHLCCIVEQKIEGGLTFVEAMSYLSETFQENEIKSIENETLSLLNSKSDLMKKLSFLTLLALLLTFTFVWGKKVQVQENTLLTSPPEIFPIVGACKISSAFGLRLHPIYKVKKQHKGIDFAAKMGTPVLATADGTITCVERMTTGYGNNITIKHDEIHETRYAQLSEITVNEGQKITQGTVIGKVGSSGSSTAPHLHYEVIKEGKAVDPELYLSQ